MPAAASALHRQLDLPGTGELDRVANQIEQNLPQAQRIAHQFRRRAGRNSADQLQPFALCAQRQGIQQFFNQVA